MAEEIVNKVEQSGLVQLDMKDFYPQGQRAEIDLKDQLWQGLALKEKDFRDWIKQEDWSKYQDQYVAVHCSADAIIPNWAYMLVASVLAPFAKKIVAGDRKTLESVLFEDFLRELDLEQYRDERLIIKGCTDLPIPEHSYAALTAKFSTVAKSVMFGEPCSTVPVFKRR